MMWKNRCLLLLAICCCYTAPAQTFRVQAALDTVPAAGFYKIAITPELSALANAGLSDIRIGVDTLHFVPYVNKQAITIKKQKLYRPLIVLTNETKGALTTLVLQDTATQGTGSISFVISNTAVQRFTSLSGSADKSHWYIIKDSISFYGGERNNEGNFAQNISFPQSRYRYYRLKIANGHSDPLQILSAGIFSTIDSLSPPGYIANPQATWTQKDSSNKHSYIIIRNTAAYVTDRVSVLVAAPKLYSRHVSVYIMGTAADSAGLYSPVTSFVLSSDSDCYAVTAGRKAAVILLDVDNSDNPPLRLSAITTMQQQQYVIAWLEKGERYRLFAGNPEAAQPDYDLSSFLNRIPVQVPEIGMGPFTVAGAIVKGPAGKSSNVWLWPSLVMAVLVLGLLTYRLAKDMKQPVK